MLRKLISIELLCLFIVLTACNLRNQNSISVIKISQLSDTAKLGRQLFFDRRLSVNNTISCATCHNPKYGFTDRLKKSRGVYDRSAFRNSPTILNVNQQLTFMFDGAVPTLEQQVLIPLQDHREMGITIGQLIAKLSRIKTYQNQSNKLFHRSLDAFVLTRSIAAFERTLSSHSSHFDAFYAGNQNALTDLQKAGWRIFSEKLTCTKCHPAPNFTNNKMENNGLYANYNNDSGRFRITGDSNDIGKFKVPTLKNCAITFPYMHDGSIETLEKVIEHYSKGGKHSQNQNKFIRRFELTPSEKKSLIHFLNSLTDTNQLL